MVADPISTESKFFFFKTSSTVLMGIDLYFFANFFAESKLISTMYLRFIFLLLNIFFECTNPILPAPIKHIFTDYIIKYNFYKIITNILTMKLFYKCNYL